MAAAKKKSPSKKKISSPRTKRGEKKSSNSKLKSNENATGPNNIIRYAVVGLGHIAQVAVLPAFKHAKKNSVLNAIVTDDPKKAKEISKKYNVKHVYNYENFGNMLTDNVVDAIYICLPNNLHVDFATEALKAGIHVLCEKPLALNWEEAEAIREASHKSDKKAMTAYRLHFEPSNLKALEVCRSGELGELRYFSSDFSMQVTDKNNIRLKRDKGGGPLWDIGIYCINAVRNIFQAEPIEVFAFEATRPDSKFYEVGEMVSATLKFPDDRLATFTCSFGAASCADYKVYGIKGSLHLKDAYEYAGPRELSVKIENGRERKTSFKKIDQFAPEIAYFSECILEDKEVEPSVIEGMADIRVIQALLESIKTHKPVELQPANVKTLRPNDEMKRSFPGFPEPETVNVTPPSK